MNHEKNRASMNENVKSGRTARGGTILYITMTADTDLREFLISKMFFNLVAVITVRYGVLW